MSRSYRHQPVTVDGKAAVVVGGTSGIGEAIALGFADDGADVIATSRTRERVDETASKLRQRGSSTISTTCDVTDSSSVRALAETAVDEFGRVDVLVNSAGIVGRTDVLDTSEQEWNRVTDVVLDGIFRTCQSFARKMDRGAIVNVSSISAQLAQANRAAYCAAKSGVEGLTRAAAKDLAPDVRVNAVAPGFVETPLSVDAFAPGTEARQHVESRAPMGRVATPDELVGAAIYLASDAAGYTTGEVLRVDGGYADSGI